MKDRQRRLAEVRRTNSDVVNAAFDEYRAGRVSRRDFVRWASVMGVSAPVVAFLASCGDDSGSSSSSAPTTTAASGGTTAGSTASSTATSAAPGGSGGTLKVASMMPTIAIDPVLVNELGSLGILAQPAEFLCYSQGDLTLRPVLAEKWSANADATEWTFTIRKGVKFHDGKDMTADDVVASIDRLADPANKSNALSAFQGVLSKGGTTKVDDYTVKFKLDGPNGNFPYLLSSDNYNAVIIPKDTVTAEFEKTMIGTGPFKLEKYDPKTGASFVRFDGYWDGPAPLDRLEFTFFSDEAAAVQALQSGTVDISQPTFVTANGGQVLLADPNFSVIEVKSSAHRQLHMRGDLDNAFKDKRVRQALALTVDREGIVSSLLSGKASIGNDSPFAPAFPSTDTSIAQRKKDIAKAKALLSDAGASSVDLELTALKTGEIPDYATVVAQGAKEAGFNLTIKVLEAGEFYGDAVFGKSPWLDAPMGIVDYGHRGVPNVFLSAPLLSDGTWNSAHFKNPTYDAAVKTYIGSVDLSAQKKAASAIQTLLLDETPIVFSYFFAQLSFAKKNVKNVETTAMGHLNAAKATVA